MTKNNTQSELKIKLVKSGTGFPEKQKRIIKGLGFKRLNEVITRPNTPQIRGMVFRIRHLVELINE
ncbi:MAG: 50S ribosomal protein L30 [Acidobacteria bacterium]|jgi:large subunit ribosomal protein L30|nr:MAG: 50S ribosomal protein L30 [Acidobacteriota bacterium]